MVKSSARKKIANQHIQFPGFFLVSRYHTIKTLNTMMAIITKRGVLSTTERTPTGGSEEFGIAQIVIDKIL